METLDWQRMFKEILIINLLGKNTLSLFAYSRVTNSVTNILPYSYNLITNIYSSFRSEKKLKYLAEESAIGGSNKDEAVRYERYLIIYTQDTCHINSIHSTLPDDLP